MLPPMSKNAQGNNYEVSISTSDVMKNLNVPVLNVDVKKMMKPIIASVSEKYKYKKLDNSENVKFKCKTVLRIRSEIDWVLILLHILP